MSLVLPGRLVQNSLRNTMIQLMFLVVQSGHPDVQKGIKTQVMFSAGIEIPVRTPRCSEGD